MANEPSQEMLDEMRRTPRAVAPDKLGELRESVREVRALERVLIDLTERAAETSKRRNEILQKKLPDLLMGAGVPAISIDPEGNLPGVEAKLVPFYYANIKADWDEERREKAFALLRKQGMGDAIKVLVTVELGLGTAKLQKAVMAALKKLKVAFTMRKGVPHTTLTAWVRERYEKGKPLSSEDLETLGATVTNIVKIKERTK